METKINLDQCRIEEITEEYRIQKLDTQGNLITESLPLYNLTAEEELNADIQVEKNGSLKIILTDRSWKEFQQMRVILAGVKNQEIYFENAVTAEKENELLLEIGHLVSELEHGRNKSTRILLETVEDGQYHRYCFSDIKRANEDRDLQKDKKSWICVQPCTDRIYLTGEDGEEGGNFLLCVYMDKGGRWFLGFGTEWRIRKMTQICHLRYLTMKKGMLNLHLVTDSHKYGYKPEQVVFRFRSKLEEERCGYNFEIKTVKIKKDLQYLDACLELKNVDLKSLYWDVVVMFANPETGERFEAAVSMTRSYRLFTSFLYRGSYETGNGFFLYPYNTSSKKLAFQFREEGEYDHLGFRVKELTAFAAYYLLKPYWDSRHIQLVYEKFCMMAQDNGYYFFKHCMDHEEEKRQKNHIYYVITKDAPDRKKLDAYQSRLVDFMSIRHMIYMIAAELLVSTDTRNHLYAMRQRGSILKRYLRKKPLVFLQHGVTALKKVDFFYGKGKSGSCDLFVVTSDFEKKIIEDYFGYAEDEIVNSGFARWDVLEDKSEGLREILIMPTWRAWLENVTLEEFKESDYFHNYMELLNSPRFHSFLEKNDLLANFYLHSKFREFIQDFSVESDRIRLIVFGEEPANELMMRCKMLVTDYSSVCWDVFYLDKPVVFFQFDRDKYMEAHGSYLDMDRELFGDCAQDVDGLLTYMERCADDRFVVRPEYEKMQKSFYKYFDDQNSRRICDAIVKKWPR
ncbi:CDP-glycerol glycerophosphotransferase family protein [Blautia difficilis]|uniref:CDP-glycerol glycerophosphotransferase family protein n=1 Tax=Blautia difficilis TaxID=2763027 RepID=A0ABR7IG65_9FIRM|nr:CDP-glycerol glycerophosphotransferase family protein [Blautia difficilis]